MPLSIQQKFLILKKRGGGEPAPQTLSQFLSSFNNLYQLIDPTNTNNVSLNSGNISQISDASGNNMHLLQATNSKQPLYSIGGLNGKNAIYFDGVNGCLTTSNYVEGVFTKFFVSDFQSPAGFIEETNTGIHYSYLFGNTGSSGEVSRFDGTTRVTVLNISSGWNLGKKIICWQFGGTFAGHRVWVNGVLVATSIGSANPGVGQLATTLNLGARNNGASNPSKGFLAHRSAFQRSLNNTEIANIFTRLNTEFSIY